jgi:1-acyl-sn-glycerol-3-phosphate acyltransferase
MTIPYQVPLRSRFFRTVVRPVFRALFYLFSPVHIHGVEHVPAQGPYLVAINHISLYEPPFIIAFWPRPLEALGAADIWGKPGQSTLARLYGGIQVHRGNVDRQMLDAALAALKAGYPLLIAPEGGRTHQPGLRQALPGVAYLVDKAGPIPVIPVGIIGTTQDYMHNALRARRPPLEMRIGAPLHLPPISGPGAETKVVGEARRKALQQNVDTIMAHIAALLPPDYRGVYAQAAADLKSWQ